MKLHSLEKVRNLIKKLSREISKLSFNIEVIREPLPGVLGNKELEHLFFGNREYFQIIFRERGNS